MPTRKTFLLLWPGHKLEGIHADESSQRYITISTHKGVYKYCTCLVPTKHGEIAPGIVVLITGASEKEYLASLKHVLEVLEQHGLRLKKDNM